SIHSNLNFQSHKQEKNSNSLNYPTHYHLHFQVKTNPKTQILHQFPKNKISTPKLHTTFSYTSPRKFHSTKAIPPTSSNTYSKTITYNQQNYHTIASRKNNNSHLHSSLIPNHF
ncbi:leukocidin family pore-forming toxin, partial [Staphylococcus aureus]|uniref:leukocidin family pore-forming toxin n=1 Tax=Staphylococcus aureus TaxID=1280 RepID=UPI001C92ECCB